MALSYPDFEVEIGPKDDDGSPLAVLQSPGGNARSRLRPTLSGNDDLLVCVRESVTHP